MSKHADVFELDRDFEPIVREELHRSIVPPHVPDYVRYRVEAMDGTMAPSRRRFVLRPEAPSWMRHHTLALRTSASIALAGVVAAAALTWQVHQSSPAASLPAGVSVTFPGRMLNWDVLPDGAGFVYIDGKGLFVTADSGADWSPARQIPGSDTERDHYWDATTLDFVDAQHGWLTSITNDVTGSQVVEYRTKDGGQTWHAIPIASFSAPASSAIFEAAQQHFTDALHGRLLLARMGLAETLAECQVWSTSDGGDTWAGPSSAGCVGLQPEVTWVTPTMGYADQVSPGSAVVSITLNGGGDWHTGALGGTWSQPWPQLLVSDGSRLLLVAREESGMLPDVVLTSTDAGGSWQRDHEVNVPTSVGGRGIVSYSELGPQHWVAIVEDAVALNPCPSGTPICADPAAGSLVETRDAGITWTPLGGRHFYGAGAIRWWDAQHGFLLADAEPCAVPAGSACPESRTVFITDDGGHTWSQVSF